MESRTSTLAHENINVCHRTILVISVDYYDPNAIITGRWPLFKQWPSCKGSMLSFVKVLKQEFYAIREEARLSP